MVGLDFLDDDDDADEEEEGLDDADEEEEGLFPQRHCCSAWTSIVY
jgi:hypothetical protein